MTAYPALEVAAAAGCTYRQLDYWSNMGYARPARGAHGSGTRRLYTLEEACAVATVAACARAGVGLPQNAPEALASGLEFATTRKLGTAPPATNPTVVLEPCGEEVLLSRLGHTHVLTVVHFPTIRALTTRNLEGTGVLV